MDKTTKILIVLLVICLLVTIGLPLVNILTDGALSSDRGEHCKLGLYTWDEKGGNWDRQRTITEQDEDFKLYTPDGTHTGTLEKLSMILPIRYMTEEEELKALDVRLVKGLEKIDRVLEQKEKEFKEKGWVWPLSFRGRMQSHYDEFCKQLQVH